MLAGVRRQSLQECGFIFPRERLSLERQMVANSLNGLVWAGTCSAATTMLWLKPMRSWPGSLGKVNLPQ